MPAEKQCKIILTDMFCHQFAQDCVDQNDCVGKNQILQLKEKKRLPNNLFDDAFDPLKLRDFCHEDSYQEIKSIILKNQSSNQSNRCDNCYRVVSRARKCKRCLKQFHERCFGVEIICYSCLNILLEGINFFIELMNFI